MKRSQLAINSVSTIRFGIEECLPAYRAAGFHNVEFPLEHVRRYLAQGHTVAEVQRLLADNDLRCIGGFDCVVECTGRPEGWRDAFEAALPGGVVTLFGGLRKGESFSVDAYRLHYEELRLHGFFHFTPDDVLRSVELLSDPGMDVESMVAGEVPLEGLEEALLAMDAGGAVKFAVAPESRGP